MHIHWRPGDDIIPPTASDYEAIPNFPPRFDPNEETTLSAIRGLSTGTFPRLKDKCKHISSSRSLRNQFAETSRLSDVNNRQSRSRQRKAYKPPQNDVSDIILRSQHLTGRRFRVGSTEVRILPRAERTQLLFYLMQEGNGLHLNINDLGDWTVDTYPELKDDFGVMRMLIDKDLCQTWKFTVDNLLCTECVAGWRRVRTHSHGADLS